jgi:peptide/nickel transport system permease protein
MLAFVIRRLLWMALVLFAISVLVFLIFFATPGVDPGSPDGWKKPVGLKRSRTSSTSSGSTVLCQFATG